jgi:hypothetical protein
MRVLQAHNLRVIGSILSATNKPIDPRSNRLNVPSECQAQSYTTAISNDFDAGRIWTIARMNRIGRVPSNWSKVRKMFIVISDPILQCPDDEHLRGGASFG